MKLSIIIVNWNTKDLLKRCIESIFYYGKNIDYEIIVIDNASKDSSQEFLSQYKNRKTYSNVLENIRIDDFRFEIVLNDQNLGFARAVNQGIKLSEGQYILLLNPDAEIKEKTLEKMIEFMENYSDYGIVGGKILNPNGSLQLSVRRFPDFFSQFLILLKLHQFFTYFPPIRKYFALDFDYSKTAEIDQAMGSFFMIRRKLIDEIDLFDEKFFVWFEEVDFCKRAKNAGWKIYYYPEAEIIHHGAPSFSQILSLKNQWQFNKSLLYYFKKHHSFLSYLALLMIFPLSLFLALITSVFPSLRKFKKL